MMPTTGIITINNALISEIEPSNFCRITINNDSTVFNGGFTYPGFVDSHGHLFGLGQKLFSLNLDKCSSEMECVQSALNSSERRGIWLLGRGWNQELWSNRSYPSKQSLDVAFPDIPVSLTRIDGHCIWVNSIALKLAGIDRYTPNPPGGEIIQDSHGEATGILVDNAISLISRLIPQHSRENINKYILVAIDQLLKNGITEVHDMDVRPDLIKFYKDLDAEHKLGIRIQSFIQAQEDEWINADVKPYQGNNFNVIGLKFYADGALGSHGAALLSPYEDKPETSGLLLINENDLIRKASKGIEEGFQIATHAIGDRANRLVINAYEKLRKKYPDAVLRIEHSQMVHPDDLERIADNNIFCAVQPIHCISDAKMARIRTSHRNKYSYTWKSLQDAGVIIGGGSDFPIESHSALEGIDAFIHRVPFNENKSWYPEECLSAEDAIKAYTLNAHMLSGNAGERGTIETGMQADITILNKDISKLSHNEFNDVKVLATIVNGELKYINPEL